MWDLYTSDRTSKHGHSGPCVRAQCARAWQARTATGIAGQLEQLRLRAGIKEVVARHRGRDGPLVQQHRRRLPRILAVVLQHGGNLPGGGHRDLGAAAGKVEGWRGECASTLCGCTALCEADAIRQPSSASEDLGEVCNASAT